MAGPLKLGRKEGTAVVLFDRPEAKNAIDVATMEALERALDAIEADGTIRALVLAGTGGTFVSGGDIRTLRTIEDVSRMGPICDRLEALPVPVLAAVNGDALGGGCEILVACDCRIGQPGISISFRQVHMGVTTGWGGAKRLVDLVGRGAAARLLLTGDVFRVEGARDVGLLDEIAPDAYAEALAWGSRIAKASPTAVRLMKQALRSPADERRAFVEAWEGPDHAEAVRAFLEKRPPVWKGR